MRHSFAKHERVMLLVGALQIASGVVWMLFHDPGFGILLATLGFLSAMRPMRDRVQYNAGWMSGRATFVMSMCEAQQRGMRPHEWLIAEAERDGLFFVEVIERDADE